MRCLLQRAVSLLVGLRMFDTRIGARERENSLVELS
jgi:hypothetical protein